MKGTMLANKSLAPSWKAQDLGLGELSRKVELKQLEIQTRTSRARLLEGLTDEAKGVALADELHRMGLI
jgi:hypothetical protein